MEKKLNDAFYGFCIMLFFVWIGFPFLLPLLAVGIVLLETWIYGGVKMRRKGMK